MHVVVETDLAALRSHIPAWESLAAAAIEPNPFYEHWMLIPAFRDLADGDVRILFIYNSSNVLCGVIPVVSRRSYRSLPIPNLSLWKHSYCFYCTPLLRAGFTEGALAAYFDWVEQNSTAWSLVEFNHTTGEGLFPSFLDAELERRQYYGYRIEGFKRAIIKPFRDGAAYLQNNLSAGKRKELRRQFHRLTDQGRVEFVELDREEDAGDWIQNFMDLEASGWKGRAGSAMLLHEPSRHFFSETMRAAHRSGRLMMLGLRVNGQPIALKCNLLATPGAFAFKIAYSEEYSRFSPGLQLELEMIMRIHRDTGIRWMDSCAVPNHSMIDHLWMERKRIQTISIPTEARFSTAILSLLGMRNRWGHVLGQWKEKVKHAA